MSRLITTLRSIFSVLAISFCASLVPKLPRGFTSVIPRRVASIVATLHIVSPILLSQPVIADDRFDNGAKLFSQNCAICHQNGGNVLPFVKDKTLFADALKDNGYEEVADIINIIAKGHGLMPGLQPPLSGEDTAIIAEYVRSQADYNWGK